MPLFAKNPLEFVKKQLQSRLCIAPLPQGLNLAQPSTLLATWFGAGLLSPASGTWGTAAALPFGYALALTGNTGIQMAALLLCTAIGIFAAQQYTNRSGEKDAKPIVIDEVAGMWLAGMAAGTSITGWVLAFLLFRVFDILKPWPACWFDKNMPNGFGIMADDLVSGAYAMGATAILMQHFGATF